MRWLSKLVEDSILCFERFLEPGRPASPPPASFYAALFTLAHRALCAAAIFLRAATDIVRFGFGA